MQELNSPALGGPGKVVEVDETFVGGKKKGLGVKANQLAKIKVLGIAERGGRIHLQTVSDTTALSILPVLDAKLDPDTAKIVTDGAPVYTHAFPKGKHEKTVHAKELNEDGFISGTRTIESAFSLFKRGIVGSYHKMSRDHMDSYLQEFCWRFNRRHMQEHLFDMALRNLGDHKPLTFKKLTREIF